MNTYHKIQTVYLRNPETNYRTLLAGQFAEPEFEYLKDNIWVFTEKIDGTNIRIMWDGANVTFAGKTDKAIIPSFLLNRLQNQLSNFKARQKFKEKFGEKTVCLYGEGYGNKIQAVGNKYIPEGVGFILFDIKIGHIWLERENVEDTAREFNIKIVPIVGQGSLVKAIEMVREGFNSQTGDLQAEGLVIKPRVELNNRRGQRIITKIKHRDFKK